MSSYNLVCTLPGNKLEQEISEEDTITIARCINDWEALAIYLGFSATEKNQIRDSPPVQNKGRECLQKWKVEKGRAATYQALITAAEKANDQQLADSVQAIL